MFLDSLNLFSDAQAVTATAASTSSIDLGPLKGLVRDVGVGENMYIGVSVDVAFTDAGSDSTITVTLETDDNSAFSSPTSVQTLGVFPALSAIGARIFARIQPNVVLEEFIQLKYTVANGNLTTGKLTAYLTHDIDAARSYANNSTIS